MLNYNYEEKSRAIHVIQFVVVCEHAENLSDQRKGNKMLSIRTELRVLCDLVDFAQYNVTIYDCIMHIVFN